MCAVAGVPDDDTVRFLVGTQSIKYENQVKRKREGKLLHVGLSLLVQVHFLEYDEDSGILNKSIYSHRAGEIWRMASSPTDYRRFATIYQNGFERQKCLLEREKTFLVFSRRFERRQSMFDLADSSSFVDGRAELAHGRRIV